MSAAASNLIDMSLFLVGGRPFPNQPSLAPVFDAFVTQAKDFFTAEEKVALFLVGDPADEQDRNVKERAQYEEVLRERWPEAQIETFWLNGDPETFEFPDEKSICAMIVGPGMPSSVLSYLAGNKSTIGRLVSAGVPYLGFSAGAAIVGKYAIVGGWKSNGRQITTPECAYGFDELTITDGLGLIGPSVETHVDARSAMGRAIEAMLVGKMANVAAIDEATCLTVTPNGRTQLAGEGRVAWLSRAGAHIDIRFESAPDLSRG